MHAFAFRARSLLFVLGFGLALACSTTDSPDKRPVEPETNEPAWPKVGDPAPPLSLDTLTGEHVALPQSDADRAAVLIFGSFS